MLPVLRVSYASGTLRSSSKSSRSRGTAMQDEDGESESRRRCRLRLKSENESQPFWPRAFDRHCESDALWQVRTIGF